MLNNKNTIMISLQRLGLSVDECKVYLALLEKPLSHLEIARKTGVNRTKIYRISDELMKRGLIAENQDDTGKQLTANDPANLEIVLKTEEAKVETKKALLSQTLPGLQAIYSAGDVRKDSDFEVNTYEGADGFKQMLWNELRANKEVLIFGSGTIENLVGSKRWAEKHRAETLEAGYTLREILNPDGKPNEFTKNTEFMEKSYNRRYISPEVLPLAHQVCVYNNTVAIYNWKNNQKVGTEIINKDFANMQRAIFKSYWLQAK